MTWTRVGDTFNDDPALLSCGRSARLLHVEGLAYSNRLLTDGLVTGPALRRITDSEDILGDVAELVRAGLWVAVADAPTEAWQLDWSDQDTAAEVTARKAYRAGVQKSYRQRRDAHARGDHSYCSERCPTRVIGNASGNETPSLPAPPRPEGRGGRDKGASAGAAGAAPRCAPRDWDRTRTEERLAHEFGPDEDDPGRCDWGDGNGWYCGSAESDPCHGHVFAWPDMPPRTDWPDERAPFAPCRLCGIQFGHPVHGPLWARDVPSARPPWPGNTIDVVEPTALDTLAESAQPADLEPEVSGSHFAVPVDGITGCALCFRLTDDPIHIAAADVDDLTAVTEPPRLTDLAQPAVAAEGD